MSGEIYICAGSKNVHLLVKNREDIDKYTNSRFNYAKEICHTILDLTDSMDRGVKKRLLDFLCETKLTAVMEMLSPRHQHVEDFSDLKKTELRFITWTSSNLETQTDTLCCMPPHVGIDIARSLGRLSALLVNQHKLIELSSKRFRTDLQFINFSLFR